MKTTLFAIILLIAYQAFAAQVITIPPGKTEVTVPAPAINNTRSTFYADISTWPKGATVRVDFYLSMDSGATYAPTPYGGATYTADGKRIEVGFEIPLTGDKTSGQRRVKAVIDNQSGVSLTTSKMTGGSK